MRLTCAGAAAFVLIACSAHAQSWQPPADNQRCPSKWGAGDERGAANLIKPETVLRASRLIRTGEVIELGHVLSAAMPLSAGRRFEVDTKRTNMNPQGNRRGSNEELVIAEIGQVGTSSTALPIRRSATASTTASRSTRSRRAPASRSSASRTSARSSRAAC